MPTLSIDSEQFRLYTHARRQFLISLGCDGSCRDPLAEFAERITCQQLGGALALSRVQKGYDLITPDNRRVQVKYLANPSAQWRNEHLIVFGDETDDYALVFFENLDVVAILVFRRETLQDVCVALGKRHPNQNRTLQFTRRNLTMILSRSPEFERMGVRCYIPNRKIAEPSDAPKSPVGREFES